MNERIEQFIVQATIIEHGADNGFDRVTFDKEKFAKLIVKEIADSIECDYKYVNVRNDCVWKTAFEIACKLREQYGIE